MHAGLLETLRRGCHRPPVVVRRPLQEVAPPDISHVPQVRLTKTLAEGKAGAFTGVVTDEAGAVVPGAKVSLTNERTRKKLMARMSGEGEFSMLSVPPGSYTLRIEVTGFKALKLERLNLNSAEVARVESILMAKGETMVVGIVVDSPMIEYSGGTMTIRGDAIRRLPIPEYTRVPYPCRFLLEYLHVKLFRLMRPRS